MTAVFDSGKGDEKQFIVISMCARCLCLNLSFFWSSSSSLKQHTLKWVWISHSLILPEKNSIPPRPSLLIVWRTIKWITMRWRSFCCRLRRSRIRSSFGRQWSSIPSPLIEQNYSLSSPVRKRRIKTVSSRKKLPPPVLLQRWKDIGSRSWIPAEWWSIGIISLCRRDHYFQCWIGNSQELFDSFFSDRSIRYMIRFIKQGSVQDPCRILKSSMTRDSIFFLKLYSGEYTE